MPSISRIITRRSMNGSDTANYNLTLGVLGLVVFALCLCTVLFVMRRMRLRKEAKLASTLPSYSESRGNNHITIQTTDKNGRSSILYIGTSNKPMLANPNSPPHSPDNVPEIRLTFPDELDESGRNQSGRVLIVRVGDSGVGLEPVPEQLPAYEKESKTQFVSIDMEQIGGLKEKETRP